MNVSQYKVGSKRFIAFIGLNYTPIFPLANTFLYDVFLNTSYSTKLRVAYELKTVLNYFDAEAIDLELRVSSGLYISANELSHFYGEMRLKKDSFSQKNLFSVPDNSESKYIRNAISASSFNKNKVSTETTTGRIRTLRKYLVYIHEHYHGVRQAPPNLKDSYNRVISKLKLRESYTQDTNKVSSVELVETVIPDEIYDSFKEIVLPSSKDNPFKKCKLRNYLILSILRQTGIRRSEVCKLKISDCQFYGDYNKIKIYSSPDDPTDTRLNKPDKKCGRAHFAGISVTLMKEIHFYIHHVRIKFEKATLHDFLFVSEKNTHKTAGLPITREMVNYILCKVSSKLGYKIHPHTLRHKWNEKLSIKGMNKGLDSEFIEDMRRSAMGWQPDSKMGRVYNDKHEQLSAIELMKEHQEKIDGTKK